MLAGFSLGRSTSILGRLAWKVGARLNQPIVRNRASIEEPIAGKRILVTGASSGIGRAVALRLADDGANVILVARRERELVLLRDEIIDAGGKAAYRCCDIADADDVAELAHWILGEFDYVDVLINNAGRSIRRPVIESFARLHDFERTMALNYFGAVHLTMGLLPAMIARQSGHVINVGTWSVPIGSSPKFAAYHSSKMALAAFGRCVDAELAGTGVNVTAVHYPLVHTAMSAPTKGYADLRGLTPEEAADWIVTAIQRRPLHMVPRYVVVLRLLGLFAPRRLDGFLWRWG